eukprot:TRINITY_DN64514_c0_g1_i1.p1 TRINITY_DN64514_c0_g1~~TRINITY_DN64514_c0_g1_i1.p1  ORF type:complete len:136 (+),score=23.49 TRINITY_DN64514_c0_g1_i1:102-509(+)
MANQLIIFVQGIDPSEGKLESGVLDDKCDPYVWFNLDGVKKQTASIDNERVPQWNEEIVFEGDELGDTPAAKELAIRVYDKDMRHDDKIGEVKLDLGTLMAGGPQSHSLKVDNHINPFRKDVYLLIQTTTNGWGN